MEMTRRGVKIERVYECQDCDKAFTREEHLKRHAKSHSDEPVHRCEVQGCPKAYTRKERLTRHYKVALDFANCYLHTNSSLLTGCPSRSRAGATILLRNLW